VANPTLSAAAEYWFVFTVTWGESLFWWDNDQGVIGGVWSGNTVNNLIQSLGNTPAPGIQVNSGIQGNSVPEPNSILLVVGSLLLLRQVRFLRQ
jgi:hypothetical protein